MQTNWNKQPVLAFKYIICLYSGGNNPEHPQSNNNYQLYTAGVLLYSCAANGVLTGMLKMWECRTIKCSTILHTWKIQDMKMREMVSMESQECINTSDTLLHCKTVMLSGHIKRVPDRCNNSNMCLRWDQFIYEFIHTSWMHERIMHSK